MTDTTENETEKVQLSTEEIADTLVRLHQMKVAQLKDICRSMELRLSGRKADLIDSIESYFKHGQEFGDNIRLLTIRTLVLRRVNGTNLPTYRELHSAISNGSYSLAGIVGDTNPTAAPSLPQQQATLHSFDSIPHKGHSLYFLESPFYKLRRSIHSSPQLCAPAKGRGECHFQFIFAADEYKLLKDNPGTKVYLLCGKQGTSGPSSTDVPIEYPSPSEIHVNGKQLLTQYKGIKGNIGTAKPADLTDLVKPPPNTNKVTLVYQQTQEAYLAYLYLVQAISPETVLERVKQRPKIHKIATIARIKAENSEDEDIMLESSTVPLTDPVSRTKIKYPIQSIYCNHTQCFDGMSFLQTQVQLPTWSCPVCSKRVKVEDLAISEYFEEILATVEEDVDSVIINADGTWEVEVQPKNEDSDAVGKPGRSASAQVETVEIISLSSDEDEDEQNDEQNEEPEDDSGIIQETAETSIEEPINVLTVKTASMEVAGPTNDDYPTTSTNELTTSVNSGSSADTSGESGLTNIKSSAALDNAIAQMEDTIEEELNDESPLANLRDARDRIRRNHSNSSIENNSENVLPELGNRSPAKTLVTHSLVSPAGSNSVSPTRTSDGPVQLQTQTSAVSANQGIGLSNIALTASINQPPNASQNQPRVANSPPPNVSTHPRSPRYSSIFINPRANQRHLHQMRQATSPRSTSPPLRPSGSSENSPVLDHARSISSKSPDTNISAPQTNSNGVHTIGTNVATSSSPLESTHNSSSPLMANVNLQIPQQTQSSPTSSSPVNSQGPIYPRVSESLASQTYQKKPNGVTSPVQSNGQHPIQPNMSHNSHQQRPHKNAAYYRQLIIALNQRRKANYLRFQQELEAMKKRHEEDIRRFKHETKSKSFEKNEQANRFRKEASMATSREMSNELMAKSDRIRDRVLSYAQERAREIVTMEKEQQSQIQNLNNSFVSDMKHLAQEIEKATRLVMELTRSSGPVGSNLSTNGVGAASSINPSNTTTSGVAASAPTAQSSHHHHHSHSHISVPTQNSQIVRPQMNQQSRSFNPGWSAQSQNLRPEQVRSASQQTFNSNMEQIGWARSRSGPSSVYKPAQPTITTQPVVQPVQPTQLTQPTRPIQSVRPQVTQVPKVHPTQHAPSSSPNLATQQIQSTSALSAQVQPNQTSSVSLQTTVPSKDSSSQESQDAFSHLSSLFEQDNGVKNPAESGQTRPMVENLTTESVQPTAAIHVSQPTNSAQSLNNSPMQNAVDIAQGSSSVPKQVSQQNRQFPSPFFVDTQESNQQKETVSTQNAQSPTISSSVATNVEKRPLPQEPLSSISAFDFPVNPSPPEKRQKITGMLGIELSKDVIGLEGSPQPESFSFGNGKETAAAKNTFALFPGHEVIDLTGDDSD
ncbi:uncharacterized protein SPAPADRAFT_47769 [Spathaspora passalidarum NRRL Y-27907]|uniref:SUMO ligase n=1 Tax=Spathaspora passalidarum (strain NRRL Y-27907 / 11-Y1) TaxID=619300 RepID=G3ADV7_SPAPN|nr:uncharacterized protein SPAPADRAFT_47769 [Spathaspora passalidarum NRRL Y-27907]EGW34681.1 hypothetical protein SPAPADRAFT_47769 [Spathaspora passalidarum NRRL Y-27907]